MEVHPSLRSGAGARRWRISPVAAVSAVLILAAFAIRLRLCGMPLERDEGEYAYAGWRMLFGEPPYVSTHTAKFPGVHAVYALAFGIFGPSVAAIRLTALAAVALSTFFLWRIVRTALSEAAAWPSAAAFALLSIDPGFLGLSAHATVFLSAFALAGAVVLLEPGRTLPRLFVSGALLGCCVLMKQHGLVFPVLAVAWIASESREDRQLRLSAFATGVLAPLLATVAALAGSGALDEFRFWALRYASAYASRLTMAEGMDMLAGAARGMGTALPWVPLLSAGAYGLKRQRGRGTAFVWGFLVAGLLAAVPGLLFRPHYFIAALPGAAILIGAGAASLERAQRFAKGHRPYLPAVALAVTALAAVGLGGPVYFASPEKASRRLYHLNPFPEAAAVARYIADHSLESDAVAVLGSEPEIPFHARRRSATPQIYAYPLMEAHPFAGQLQRAMIADIETARPAFVVFVGVRTSWLPQEGADRTIFDWADRFLTEEYVRVGIVDIFPQETFYRWDKDAAGEPKARNHVLVYRRKDRAA